MKLPWVRKYLVIAFHVAVTFTVIYLIKTAIDMGSMFILDLNGLISEIIGAFRKFMSVFSVVIAAFAIAYILDPAADFIQEKWNKLINKNETSNRTVGASVIFIIFAAVTALFIYMGYKKFGTHEFTHKQFINESTEKFTESYSNFRNYIKKSGFSDYIMPLLDFFSDKVTQFADNIGKLLFNIAVSAGTGIADIIAALVISFYFIKDKKRIIDNTKKAGKVLLNEKVYSCISDFFNEAHCIFSGYIRGQITDATIMSILISSTLSIIGVDFAVIIGIISGYSNIIPYFGALIGLLLSVLAALISGSAGKAVITAVAVLILQQIDGIIIVPRIIGDKVSLSPVLVIIALTVFGKLFGIVGMIFAVPVFAVIKIYLVRLYERKSQKKEAPDN